TGGAIDEKCRSQAENDKDHTKSELLFARQPDLLAALTSVAGPLILSTETARRSFETLTFFRKRPRTSHPTMRRLCWEKLITLLFQPSFFAGSLHNSSFFLLTFPWPGFPRMTEA